MRLVYRKDYIEPDDIIPDLVYPEYRSDLMTVLGTYALVKIQTFSTEMTEIKAMKYNLDQFPEEAFGDIGTIYEELQGYASRVTSILIDMYQYRADLKRVLSDAEKIYKRLKMRALAKDPDIKKLRNKELQEAYISDRFDYVVNVIDNMTMHVDNIDELISIVLLRDKDLERANMNVSRQQRFVEDLLSQSHPVNPRHVRYHFKINGLEKS